ncbi:MAG: DUF2029 domain-containing protein [Candidatus Hydrogenedentes bacterium]|nr:DUF2029 domain-containing protein [Candidatus Hydrogenedentota bacterium]
MNRTKARWALGAVLCLALVAGYVPEAGAFYPWGFFDEGGQLVYLKWDLDYMDVNGDGDVADTATSDEGVELNFEGGPLGWADSEKAKVIAGYETWENVPTAYIAFRYGPDIPGNVELDMGFDNIDLINFVALELPEDTTQVMPSGTYGLVLFAATYEQTLISIGGSQVYVDKGQMIDVDSVYWGEGTRLIEDYYGFGFQGSGAIMGGMICGLGFSPWDNFDEAASQAAGVNIEKRVVCLRNGAGQLVSVGVTPTMYNGFFFYDEGAGLLADSHEDLAPDDIAGITFLYPRGDTDAFFNLSEQARTFTREGYPSSQIGGAHIMAWCDTDNNPSSARVPFIDTLTGLFERDATSSSNTRGNFVLRNLFKQLEDSNEIPFTASYTFTCAEFEPVMFSQADYDTTHGGSLIFGSDSGTEGAISFASLFPSQVFHEAGNLFGLDNLDQGTPLEFDLTTRKIVSSSTGKTLDTILAAGRPMFGDANQMCPYNVVVAGLKTTRGPNALRYARDSVLLNSAVGVALMDTYYRVSPAMAQFLLRHERLLATAQAGAAGVEWLLGHGTALTAGLVGLAAGLAAFRLRRKRSRAALTASLLVAALCWVAAPAHAQFAFKDMEEYVAASDDIVTGRVTAAESHWTADGRKIVTDVTVKVDDVVKGRFNKSGNVYFSLPTGRVGPIGRFCPQLPRFEKDEDVLLFLEDRGEHGLMIVGGLTGKYNVKTNQETGEKSVYAGSNAAKVRLDRAAAKMAEQGAQSEQAGADGESDEQDRRVDLEDFKDYLRGIAAEQGKAE